MDYEDHKRICCRIAHAQDQARLNEHEKDPYVWKSKPPSFAKDKHNTQKIDELMSNLQSFYKLDNWDKYVSHATEEWVKYLSQDVESTRAMSVGNFEFRNGPDGGINMTMVPKSEKGPKRLFISPPPRCGKTLAMEAYKQFCENMEERNMNNITNKNLNDSESTKEIIERMYKIRKTNDPRAMYNTGNIYVVIDGKAYIPETMEVRPGFREAMEYDFSVSTDPSYVVENTMLAIKNVIFNPPATIVFWGDGSKTVVKAQNNEEYDPEKGLTMAFFKRMHGNKGHYFEEIKKWTKKYPVTSNGVTVLTVGANASSKK